MELGEGVEHVEPLHVYNRRVDAELGPENWEIVQSDLISQKKDDETCASIRHMCYHHVIDEKYG